MHRKPNSPSILLTDLSGFTLVEVMISAAISLVIALAISQLIVDMNRQQAETKARADAHFMLQQITTDMKGKTLPTP